MPATTNAETPVWQTNCPEPALVIEIEHERREVRRGYNIAGFPRSTELMRWLHSEPDLADLWERAAEMEVPADRARADRGSVDVPKILILLVLGERKPQFDISAAAVRTIEPLRDWIWSERQEQLSALFWDAVMLSEIDLTRGESDDDAP